MVVVVLMKLLVVVVVRLVGDSDGDKVGAALVNSWSDGSS